MEFCFMLWYIISLALVVSCAVGAENTSSSPFMLFSFEGFGNNYSEVVVYGDARIMKNDVVFGKGKVVYKKPVRLLGENSGFSTYLSFELSEGNGKEGLSFFMVGRNGSVVVVAVDFVNRSEIGGGGGEGMYKRCNASSVGLGVGSGERLHSWIDYDGVLKRLEVRVGKSKDLKPLRGAISCPIDLSGAFWNEAMFVGVSSSSWNSSLYSWSFVVNHGAPYLMHSEPLDPRAFVVQSDKGTEVHHGNYAWWKLLIALVVGAVLGYIAMFVVSFLRYTVVNRHPVSPEVCAVDSVEIGNEKVGLVGEKVADVPAK